MENGFHLTRPDRFNSMEFDQIKNVIIGLIFFWMAFRIQSKYNKKEGPDGKPIRETPTVWEEISIFCLYICGGIMILLSFILNL